MTAVATLPEYRALMMFDRLPAGCVAFLCKNESSLPHVRPGEFVVVDTNDRKPRHGELYVISFGKLVRHQHICMVRRRSKCGWVDQNYGPDGWTVGSVRNEECRRIMERLHAHREAGRITGTEWAEAAFEATRVTTAWTEGPYQESGPSYEHLCSCLVGCVIGLYAPTFEEPRKATS